MPLPILGAIGSALGSLFSGATLGKLATGAVGSIVGKAIDRAGDRASREDEWNFYKKQGATLSEIMGNGGVGTGSSTGQAVLGNQMSQLESQKMQLEYDAQQRALDRAVQLSGQETALEGAKISAGASMYGADVQAKIAQGQLAIQQRRFDNIELPKALNDIVTSTPDWKRQELLARMGADNVIATVIAGSMGIDVMDPNSLSNLSDREFRTLVNTVFGLQSTVFKEAAGASMTINNATAEAGHGVGQVGDWIDRMLGRRSPASTGGGF